MGIEYKLFRNDTRVAFDLGKGWWSQAFPHTNYSSEPTCFLLSDLVKTPVELAGIIRHKVYSDALDVPAKDAYCLLVADRIFAWCGLAACWLKSDSSDCDAWEQYEVTADRYDPTYVVTRQIKPTEPECLV